MQELQPTPEEIEGAAPRTPYDEVPYASYPYSQSHPNRLAVVGTLLGMTPAAVERCRVLELGCASGGNLTPIAADFPDASFVGIDLSARQISDGAEMVKSLGLRNVELRQFSITDVNASFGKFDYIICHGVYSWVPAEVRQKILEICGECLNPQGIAYISYNTYPGWHMRGTVRDMMVFHVRKWTKPEDRASQARALLDWLAKTVPEHDNAYSSLLRTESERLRNNADSYILHEHLETVNEPTYFYEFAEAAATKGLQFLAEAQSGARWLEGLGPAVDQMVRQLSRDVIEYEQYLDFLQNRMFRRSLVCHANVRLERNLNPKVMRNIYAASSAVAEGPVNPQTNEDAKFRVDEGVLTTGLPIMKASLLVLGERWPEAMPFGELLDETLKRIGGGAAVPAEQMESLADALATNLAHAFIRRVVELYVAPPRVRARAGDFPKTTPIARMQAPVQMHITTQLHAAVAVGPLARRVVGLADGSRTRADIYEELLKAVHNGGLVMVNQAGQPTSDVPLEPALEDALAKSLVELARLGLIID